MERTKLKKHMALEKYMSNTRRERHTREDNNNINIKGPTFLCSASIVLLLLLNMCLCHLNHTIYLEKKKKRLL